MILLLANHRIQERRRRTRRKFSVLVVMSDNSQEHKMTQCTKCKRCRHERCSSLEKAIACKCYICYLGVCSEHA